MKTLFASVLISCLFFLPALRADEVRLLPSPVQSLAARVESIQAAREKIYIETFYWENDRLGNALLAILASKKKIIPNIDIKILLDDFGSASFPKSKLCFAKALGISIKMFNPVKKSNPLLSQRRDHRKMWMTEKTYFLGGRNLSDENFDSKKWDLDAQFTIEQLSNVENTIMSMWDQSVELNCENVKPEAPSFELTIRDYAKSHLKNIEWHSVDVELAFDFGMDEKSTYLQFIKQLQDARESVLIESGYFTPNQTVLNLLKSQSRLGVTTQITTNSPFFEYWMGTISTCAAIKYQKQILNLPGVIVKHPIDSNSTHSKILYTDRSVFSFGSFNVHEKSFSWNAETWVTLRNLSLGFKKEIETTLNERKLLSRTISHPKDFNLQSQTIKNQLKCSTYEIFAPILRPFI